MVYECHSAADRFAARRVSSYAYDMLAMLTMTDKLAAPQLQERGSLVGLVKITPLSISLGCTHLAGRSIPKIVLRQDLLAAHTIGLQRHTLCVQVLPSSGRERLLITARSCYYQENSPS